MCDAVVVHFEGPDKPWTDAAPFGPYREEWFAALDDSPWAGWRPPVRLGAAGPGGGVGSVGA
jgi:lipopolysaccharide biosynthesis glycosyltransferase